jgi:hypothetical protein
MLKEIGADVRGICTRPYIIGITGNLIYKALKKRLVSGVILLGTLFYLGNRAFQFDIQGATIAVTTLCLAIAGFAAQKWGNWAMKRSLLHAEAHGANLLENKKRKRFIELYLPDLYTHVYHPEAMVKHDRMELAAASDRHEKLFKNLLLDRLKRYSNTPEANAIIGKPDRSTGSISLPNITSAERRQIDPAFIDGSGHVAATMLGGAWLDLGEYVVRTGETLMSHLGFMAALRYSLVRSDRQRDERADIGIDLSFLEDYLDGACFHPNNTKIMEQSRHSLIRQIETDVYRRGLGEKISHSLRRMLQKRWHTYINTSVQASVGNLLYTLSTAYATRSLAVEDVLWRDEQGRRLLRRQLIEEFSDVDNPEHRADQLIEELDRGTMKILNKIFHASPLEAERVVRREYAYSVEQSIQRRVRYDHQYAMGELPSGPVEDLQRIGAEPRTVDQIQKLMKRASEEINRFRSLLDGADFSNLWRRYTPEVRRALEVAYFTNEANFKEIIAGNSGDNSAAIRECADVLAERFTAEASEKLRRLRLHHQLALFEYVDTLKQLIELAYGDTAFDADAEAAPETAEKNA